MDKDKYYKDLESRVKALCTSRKITFTELADRIGMSRSGLFLAFKRKSISVNTMMQIASMFDMDFTAILGWRTNASETRFTNLVNEIKLLILTSLGDGAGVAEKKLDILNDLYGSLLAYTKSLEKLNDALELKNEVKSEMIDYMSSKEDQNSETLEMQENIIRNQGDIIDNLKSKKE